MVSASMAGVLEPPLESTGSYPSMRKTLATPLFLITSVVLAAGLLLGGGTRQGFVGDVWVQLLAIPLLLTTLWAAFTVGRATWRDLLVPLLVLGVFIVAALGHVTPLPHSLVASLSSVERWPSVAAPSALAALAQMPDAAWAALVSVLPPVAVFFSIAHLPASARRHLAGLILMLGGLSVVLGLLQVAQGANSPLRLFEVTNPSEAVGFFANRNHLAALLYTSLLLAAPLLIVAAQRLAEDGRASALSLVGFAGACCLILALIAGVAMARSRAGVGLAMIALLVIAALTVRAVASPGHGARARGGWMAPQRWVLGLLAFAVVFAAQFGLARIMTSFGRDAMEDLRFGLTWTTLDAAWHNLPLGAGLGSFVPVFQMFERASDITSSYANRAHNDFAEFGLEMGVVGIVIMMLALVWLIHRLWVVWRHPDLDLAPRDVLLQRVAGVACLLLIAHSLVDYPLRTTAMAIVFAFCLGLLTRPTPNPRAAEETFKSATPHKVRQRTTPSVAPSAIRPVSAAPPQRAWMDAIEWPETWQNGSDTRRKS